LLALVVGVAVVADLVAGGYVEARRVERRNE
jgi:hypothetical protein